MLKMAKKLCINLVISHMNMSVNILSPSALACKYTDAGCLERCTPHAVIKLDQKWSTSQRQILICSFFTQCLIYQPTFGSNGWSLLRYHGGGSAVIM